MTHPYIPKGTPVNVHFPSTTIPGTLLKCWKYDGNTYCMVLPDGPEDESPLQVRLERVREVPGHSA